MARTVGHGQRDLTDMGHGQRDLTDAGHGQDSRISLTWDMIMIEGPHRRGSWPGQWISLMWAGEE